MADAPMDRELQKSMALAFAPVHKRALGVAAGLTFGVLVAGGIAIHESLYAYRMHGKNNHSTGSVVGSTFATSRNDWKTINRDVLQLIHKEMLARQDELCAAIGTGHFSHSLALFEAGIADMNRSEDTDKVREESQDDSGGVLVRLGKLFGNGR